MNQQNLPLPSASSSVFILIAVSVLLQVKLKALDLAEMQAFLQKRVDEDDKVQREIRNLSDDLER